MKKTLALSLLLLLLVSLFVSCGPSYAVGLWEYTDAKGQKQEIFLNRDEIYTPELGMGLPVYQQLGNTYYFVEYGEFDTDGRPLSLSVLAHRTLTITEQEDGILLMVAEDLEKGTKETYVCTFLSAQDPEYFDWKDESSKEESSKEESSKAA